MVTVLIFVCNAIAVAVTVVVLSGVIGWGVGTWLEQRSHGYRCAWEERSNVRLIERPALFDQDAPA